MLGLSRRTFLVTGAAAGGGLLLGVYFPRTTGAKAQAADETLAPGAFVRIKPDDTITLIMPQVEMGQGTYTSMSMLIAEELEVDLAKISLEAAPPSDKLYANPLLGFQVTGGLNLRAGIWDPAPRRRDRSRHADPGGGGPVDVDPAHAAPRRRGGFCDGRAAQLWSSRRRGVEAVGA